MISKARRIKVANMAARRACQSLNRLPFAAPTKASFAMNAGRNSREIKSAPSKSVGRTGAATRPV